MTFSCFTERRTGWEGEIIVLKTQDGELEQEARIAPTGGCNLFSYIVNGVERLRQPPSWRDVPTFYYGIPILFPTPNRVRDCRYEFEGRTYQHRKNHEDRFLHGLVYDEWWKPGEVIASSTTASFSAWLEMQPYHHNFPAFPFPHKITVTFTLMADRLTIAYEVENTGESRLPFGFGLHPWFQVPRRREDMIICGPATHELELEPKLLLPTTKYWPIQEARPDLSQPTPLSQIDLDTVYFGMRPEKPAWIEYVDEKLRLELHATADFTHLIVYSPADKDFVCVENQTCSGDVHNLYARGFQNIAHLLILDAGQKHCGAVQMVWCNPTRLPGK